jgi:hypothetical protein
MKTTALFVTLLALSITSCSSVSHEKSGPRATQVPMEIVNRTPVLSFRINDIDVRLQLDTGSGTTLTLYPHILDQLETVSTGETHQSMGMEGVAMENPVYEVARVALGGAEYHDLQVRQDDHTEQHRIDTIEYRGTYGRVGRGLFDNGKLIIDYQNESMTIIPPDAPEDDQAACRGVAIPLELDKESLGLTTKVQTDIGELYAVWDTGAGGNIMLKRTTDAAGLELQARDKFRTEKFVINGHDFGPVRMNIWDIPILPPDLHTLLGYRFFSDKVVCIDFPRNSLYVRFPSDT